MPPSKKRERAASILTEGGVTTLLRSLANSAAPGPVLQVIALRRHALDEKWFTATKEKDRPQLEDAYDVTLSDGAHTVKCALSTALNGRIYRGWLRPLVAVRVADWGHIVDERIENSGAAQRIVVLKQLEAVRKADEPPAHPRVERGLLVPDGEDDVELQIHPDALVGGPLAQERQSAVRRRHHPEMTPEGEGRPLGEGGLDGRRCGGDGVEGVDT